MRLLLLTIFICCGLLVFSQDDYPPVVNYSTQQYGKEINPEIYCAVQDPRGVMYFGTGNGVLEFDGQKWRFIQVQAGAFVRSIGVDSSGVIYVGSSGDFGYLKPNDKGDLVYKTLCNQLDEMDKFFFDVWTIHITKNEVFFQAQESIFRYDLKSKKVEIHYPDFSFHRSFLVNSTLYVRAREIGVQKFENGALSTLPGTEIFQIYGLFGVFELEDDSLLFVTQELGLWKWKDSSMRQLPEQNVVALSELGIFGSVQLSEKTYVLNTFTNGIFVIDSKGKIIKHMDRSKGIRSNDVKSVFEDRDQNLWLSLGNGISKVNYHSPLSYFNEKTGIDGNVEAIIRFKDKLYVGTSFGLFVQDQSQTKNSEFVNSQLIKNQVWDFCIVGDELFIATTAGIYSTNGNGTFSLKNNRNSNMVFFIEKENRFVSAGSDGIIVYNRAFDQIWISENISDRFLAAELDPIDPNTLWIGSMQTGVYRLKWKESEFILDQFSNNDGLIDDNLGKPIIFQNQVVFGSSQGLLKFIHEDEMVKDLPDSLKNDPMYHRGMFDSQALHDSLFFDSQILFINEDSDRTWFCADHKIAYFDYQTKQFINKPFWGINYGRVNEFYLEDNGVLWIGCADGLIRYEKNTQKKYDSKYYSVIREFSINRDSVIFYGAATNDSGLVKVGQNKNEKIELAYAFNDVYFQFSAPYFEDEHVPEFSYFLEGLDEDWSEWGVENDANFTNLPEGDYVFKVKARNIYGHLSEEAVFHFSILPPWYRTAWAYTLYVLAFVLVLFIGVKISSARLKSKNIWLEGVVEERTKEISDKNVVLEHQQKEIHDSINYAKRIQLAILPLEAEMKKWIPNSFILFRPKDVVSGDFYWFQEKEGKLIIVCSDCTGHGVPGAFMSMIGSDRLNNIVNELHIYEPGKILAELSRAIKRSLKQDGEKNSTRDGMDAAICTIDLAKKTMKYAGANRPLWIVKDGAIEEIKANKVAVAGFTADNQIFDEHEIELNPGLKFYMTSDGYADQFGGEKGKKYMVKNMKEFILQHCNNPYTDQRDQLETELVSWMGPHEQIDDVCVIGFEA